MKSTLDKLIVPEKYHTPLSVMETQVAIKLVKDYFERELAKALNLVRVSAPLFVRPETGLNDNLNGIERPVSFEVKGIGDNIVEIVQSLAKWKRMALKKYGFKYGEGLYTDMNAIRRDDELDNLHSVYVDQWDWERVIKKEDRNLDFLKNITNKIFDVFKATERYICTKYPQLDRFLPEEMFYITTQELEDLYPELLPKQREEMIAREKKAVFIMQIGGTLKSGVRHDGRAPDYDDWTLNGDIIFWYPVLESAVEVSSMGIRVDEQALFEQLRAAKCEERKELQYHKNLLEGKFPLTIGGGIGQSRICMFFLGKAHIGEVQSSVWSEETVDYCRKANIILL